MIGTKGRAARVSAVALAGLLALVIGVASTATSAEGEAGLNGTVNVNTATLEELTLLPGIGESRAQAVIETRKRRGGFKSVDDLMEVKGIGEASLERLRPHVTTQGKTTARMTP
jgi:competence protein ComEA